MDRQKLFINSILGPNKACSDEDRKRIESDIQKIVNSDTVVYANTKKICFNPW